MNYLNRYLSIIALAMLCGFIIYFFVDRSIYSKKVKAKIYAIEQISQKLKKAVDSIAIVTKEKDIELRTALMVQIKTIETISSTIDNSSKVQAEIRAIIKLNEEKLDSIFNN